MLNDKKKRSNNQGLQQDNQNERDDGTAEDCPKSAEQSSDQSMQSTVDSSAKPIIKKQSQLTGWEKARRVLLVMFSAAFLVSSFVLAQHYIGIWQEEKELEQLYTMVSTEASPEQDTAAAQQGEVRTAMQSYELLHAQNPDYLGWISIADTEISYPVMYTPDQPQKYLRLNFGGTSSLSGVPFLEAACRVEEGDSTDNWIIYGHNMKSSTMFSTLTKYADIAYWQAHPVIRFEVQGRELEFEVLGAFYSRIYAADEEGFRYYTFVDAGSAAAYDSFVDSVQASALYDTGVSAEYGDQLLTLSTCSYHVQDGRFAVVAVLHNAQ